MNNKFERGDLFCPLWHEYTEENTYIDKHGYKHCRTCARDRMRALRSINPGPGRGNNNSVKIKCPKGHFYTPENTYITKKGSRSCRMCAKINAAQQKVLKYGITKQQFFELLDIQQNACYICKKKFCGDIEVDHDHNCCDKPNRACGKCVRGLLCGECNRGLARFKDDTQLLKRAIEYLEKPPFTGYVAQTN